MNEKTSLGMDARLEAVLGYLGFVGIIWLFVEKESKFVRNHALQSAALFIIYVAARIIGIIPILGDIVVWIVGLACLVFGLIAIINAIQGNEFEIPYVGPAAKNIWEKSGL